MALILGFGFLDLHCLGDWGFLFLLGVLDGNSFHLLSFFNFPFEFLLKFCFRKAREMLVEKKVGVVCQNQGGVKNENINFLFNVDTL